MYHCTYDTRTLLCAVNGSSCEQYSKSNCTKIFEKKAVDGGRKATRGTTGHKGSDGAIFDEGTGTGRNSDPDVRNDVRRRRKKPLVMQTKNPGKTRTESPTSTIPRIRQTDTTRRKEETTQLSASRSPATPPLHPFLYFFALHSCIRARADPCRRFFV